MARSDDASRLSSSGRPAHTAGVCCIGTRCLPSADTHTLVHPDFFPRPPFTQHSTCLCASVWAEGGAELSAVSAAAAK